MTGEPIDRLRSGLLTMLDELEPEDRVTLVGFADDAELIAEQLGADAPELTVAIEALEPGGHTNLYAGLRMAFEEVHAFAQDGWQNRVLLVSDGVANVGLVQDETIEGLAEAWGNDAYIDIPILQIAHRVSADDNENGRRGGGGAIILELLPTGLDPAEVGHIDFSYTEPGTGELIEQSVEITSPLAPWETPEGGLFEGEAVEKGFVMLNIYVAFEMAAERASFGDYASALTILRPLGDSVADWLGDHDDADIEDDLLYVDLFIHNLENQGGETHTPNPVPPDPWPAD